MFRANPLTLFKNTVLFFAFIFSLTVASQEAKVDSLQQYSFKTLDSLYATIFFKDILQAQKFAQANLDKAISEQNYLEQANSIQKLAVIENRQDRFETAHQYIDKAIVLAKQKIRDNDLISGYLNFKGNIYYSATDYENAILAYVEAYEYQKDNRESQMSLDIAHNIALIKSTVGDEQEAKKIFINNYKLYVALEKKEATSFDPFSYVGTLIALSDTYLDEAIETEEKQLKNMLLDSATYYNNIGFEKSDQYRDFDGHNYFLIRRGIISYEKKAYTKALKDFNLALEKANDLEQTSTLTSIYFNLAKYYYKFKKYDTVIVYYKKIDSISSAEAEPSTYLPETYLALAKLYIEKSDAKNALKYHNLYAKIDAAADKKTIEVYKKIHGEHHLKVLHDEIKKLEKEKEANYTTSISVIVSFIIAFAIFLLFNQRRQRKNRLAFNDLMNQLETKKTEVLKEKSQVAATKLKSNTKSKSSISINDQKVNEIVKALDKFEQKKQFLDINCDLAFVAKKVKTNKAYLSKVIHSEKQQKFIQYITNLRINYALEKLKEDKLFRSYDIKSIASELGFKSPDSFSRAFKSKTGIYPSYYIKNINKINDSEDK